MLGLILGEDANFNGGNTTYKLTRIFDIISQKRYKFFVIPCEEEIEHKYLVKAFPYDYDFSKHDDGDYNQPYDGSSSDTLFSFYINIVEEHSDIKIVKGTSLISCASEVESSEIIRGMTNISFKNLMKSVINVRIFL